MNNKAHKRVEKHICRNKRVSMDQLAAKAEEVAAQGKQGNIYKITKQVRGKFIGNTEGKGKHRKLLTTEKEHEEIMTITLQNSCYAQKL